MSLMTDIAAEPAAPAAAPPAAPITEGGPDGGSHAAPPTPSTRWTVPEDYRNQDAVRKFMDDKFTLDPEVLIKSHVNLESKLGRDKIPVPTTDEEWSEAYAKLGRPAGPEGYTYQPPADLPEGVVHNPETEKFWRNAAHANGLSDKQFNGLAKLMLDHQSQATGAWLAAQDDERKQGDASLRREWGQAYDQNANAAKVAIKEYGGDDLVAELESLGLGNNHKLLRAFAKIGAELLPDAKLKGDGTTNGQMTPAQAQQRITEFRAEHHKALFDGEHPDHNRLVRQLEQLHAAAVGR